MRRRTHFLLMAMLLVVTACGTTDDVSPAEEGTTAPPDATDTTIGVEEDSPEPEDGGTVRIGMVVPTTGPYSYLGEQYGQGLRLFLDEIEYAVGSIEIELLEEDSAFDADTAVRATRQLLDRDIDFLVGFAGSHETLAVMGIVEEQAVPTITMAAISRDITVPENAVTSLLRTVPTTDQTGVTFGSWLATEGGFERMALFGEDILAAHHYLEAVQAGFVENGGEVIEATYAPLGSADWSPYISQLQTVDVDVIASFFAGPGSLRFLQQAQDFGLSDQVQIAGYYPIIDEAFLGQLGPEADAVITSNYWNASLDRPGVGPFVERFESALGFVPNVQAAAGYADGQMIAWVVEEMNGDLSDSQAVIQSLRSAPSEVETALGPFTFDEYGQWMGDIFIVEGVYDPDGFWYEIVGEIPQVAQADVWTWWRE